MFTFFHRKKTITVDCFTAEASTYKATPVQMAKHNIPQWFKTLPKINWQTNPRNKIKDTNMRGCVGFIDLYKRGFILESWADFKINISQNDDKVYMEWSTGSQPAHHSSDQYNNYFEYHKHLKLISPWFLQEKTGVPFIMQPASWTHRNLPVLIPPGVLDFKYQCVTNVNILFPVADQDYEITIPLGQPLVHFVPLRDDYNYKVANHLVSIDEISRKSFSQISYSSVALRNLIKKRFDLTK